MARDLLPGEDTELALVRALRLGLRHGRAERDLLPPAQARDRCGWTEQAPAGFLFAVKGSRDLTHMHRLRDIGASLALGHDHRRPLPDASPVGPTAYLRLHYGSRGRQGNYSDAELDTWRRRIAAWRANREVFVYLNNDWQTFAPRNALTLRRGLS